MQRKKIIEFINAGCQLASQLQIFGAIYGVTSGYPCEGCAYDSHGSKCEAKRKLFAPQRAAKEEKQKGETVRETAARLGVSISEVRRRRRVA